MTLSGDALLTLVVAVYFLVAMVLIWHAHRAYRREFGFDMDTQHQSIVVVLALLWPLTVPSTVITLLALYIIRRLK